MNDAPKYNPELLKRLLAYKETHNLQGKDLARELDVHPSAVSRYFHGKPEGDVTRLEHAIEDVLRTAETRALNKAELFETSVTRQIFNRINTIRKTNDFGILYGPAGCGKTSATQLYSVQNPTCIRIELTAWSANAAGIERLIFERIETKTWKYKLSKSRYIMNRLAHSNRLLIADSAQRLSAHGLSWLFDFHDHTGCPVLLTGNPEILTQIERSDQHFSRIGMAKAVDLRDDLPDVVARIIAKTVPDPDADILDLAIRVSKGRGRLRALRKQLLLAMDIHSSPRYRGTLREAFLTAHTQLVRDYNLD